MLSKVDISVVILTLKLIVSPKRVVQVELVIVVLALTVPIEMQTVMLTVVVTVLAKRATYIMFAFLSLCRSFRMSLFVSFAVSVFVSLVRSFCL